MSARETQEAVERGAALLDEKLPGWETKIDQALFDGSFNMGSWESCVVGTLELVVWDRKEDRTGDLNVDIVLNGRRLTTEAEARAHGFYPDGDTYHWTERVAMLWKEQVHQRLGKAAKS